LRGADEMVIRVEEFQADGALEVRAEVPGSRDQADG
jgi:hypothetical protein